MDVSKVGQVGGAEEVDEGDVQLSSAFRAYGPAQPACPESFFGVVSRSCPGKTKTVSMALALEAPAVFRDVVEGVWRSVASSAESLCAARIARATLLVNKKLGAEKVGRLAHVAVRLERP